MGPPAAGDLDRTHALPAAKLRPPAPPPGLVRRDRLRPRLTRGPVTVVEAGPGTGKTTLLLTWASDPSRAGRVAWLTLDPGDDEVPRLTAGIRAALRSLVANHPPVTNQPSATPPHHPPEGVQPVAASEDDGGATTPTAAALQAIGRVPGELTLILDDLHRVTAPEAVATLAEVLTQRPGNLRVVLSGRGGAASRLAAARSEAVETVRGPDLAFTAVEAAALLTRLGVTGDPALAERLVARTGGWAAVLGLAALALTETSEGPPHTDVPEREGGDPIGLETRNLDVVDASLASYLDVSLASYLDVSLASYLDAELLDPASEADRAFLLAVSAAEELTDGLAAALTGTADADRRLAALHRESPALTRAATSSQAYRIPELVRTHLQAEARRRDPAAWRATNRTLAHWEQAAGRPWQAVVAGARADDQELTCQLLAANGPSLLLAAPAPASGFALRLLPIAWHREPDAATVLAGLCVADGAVRRAGALIDAASPPGPGRPQVLRAAVEVELARGLGDDDRRRAARNVLEAAVPDPHDDDLSLLLHHARGGARLRDRDLPGAIADLDRAVELALRTGREHIAVTALARLTGLEGLRGEVAAAERAAEQAIGLAAPWGWDRQPILLPVRVLLSWLATMRGEPSLARRHAEEAAASLRADSDRELRLAVELAVAGCDVLALGDPYPALQRLRARWERETLRAAGASAATLASWGLLELQGWLRVGEPDQARRVQSLLARELPDRGEPQVAAALIALAERRPGVARQHLTGVVSDAPTCRDPANGILARVVLARLLLQEGETVDADSILRQAVALAAPARLSLPFEAGGSEVAAWLANRATTDPVVRVLCAQRRGASAEDAAPVLTRAELELLRMLPSRTTVGDLAAARGVSVNTVKTHLRAVYRKLGAGNRREAVRRAEELGLL